MTSYSKAVDAAATGTRRIQLDPDILKAYAAAGVSPTARPAPRDLGPGKIDMTPMYRDVLPALFAVLENGTAEGKRMAREELTRMAAIADLYNLTGGARG